MRHTIESLEPRQLFAVLLPDLNFGTNGTAPLEPSSQITPLTNGKILALGGGYKTLLATGLPDPDSSDVNTGLFNTSLALPTGVAYQADSTSRLEGDEETGTLIPQLVFAKYDANGELDSTFGTNGQVRFDLPATFAGKNVDDSRLRSLALRTNGKLLAAGVFSESGSSVATLFLVQLNTNGTLDTTFGTNGYLALTPDAESPNASTFGDPTVRVDSTNRPVVYVASNTGTGNGTLFRLTSGNVLDTTFSGDGKVVFAGQQGLLEIDSANRPVVAFTTATGTGSSTQQRVNIRRYTTAGAVDTGFGTAGTASFADPQRGSGTDLDVDSSNRVVIGVEGKIYRLTNAGVLDSSFADNGQIDLTNLYSFPLQIDVLTDNKVLVSDGGSVLQLVPRPAVLLSNDGVLALTGTAGNDTISLTRSGSNVTATVNGTSQNFVVANVDRISISGAAGNDTITLTDAFITDSAPFIEGGLGTDTFDITDSGPVTVRDEGGNSDVTVDGSALSFSGNAAAADDITITGDGFAEIFTGLGSTVSLGNSGSFVSFIGRATITGGAGDDTIQSRPDPLARVVTGGANVNGGAGDDRIVIDHNTSGSTLLGGAGDDYLATALGANYFFGGDGRDDIKGGTGADTLTGGTGKDTLRGGAGNDLINGGGGGDRLFGGDGLDYLYGGPGDDGIDGNAGSDHIYGGLGLSIIDAGGGNDTMEVTAQATINAGAGNDTIFARNSVIDLINGGSGNDSAQLDSNDDDSSIETLLA